MDPGNAIKLTDNRGLRSPSSQLCLRRGDGTDNLPSATSTTGQDATSGEPPVETQEQAEAEAQRLKAERAANLKAARDAAAKDPNVQKQKWLRGAAELIAKIGEKKKECNRVKFPNGMEKTYEKDFIEHCNELKEIREWLEVPCAKKAVKAKLEVAKTTVEAINTDIKAFEGLLSTYSKK